jgi:hypothetical protein
MPDGDFEILAAGERRSTGFFFGLQSRWLSSDRLYRVYVSDRMLAGAYIAGQIYDEQSAAVQLQQLGLFLRPLVRRRLAQRREREAIYDSINPFGPSLLNLDQRNFQILRSDVARTRLRQNRSLWAPFSVGVAEVELFDGKTWRLIVVGDQEPDEVLKLMQRFDAAIEVTGKPNPRPRPTPMSPAGQRFRFVFFAVLLLGFATWFAYTAIAGVAPGPTHVLLVIVNIVAGAWCLVKAWTVPRNQPERDDLSLTNRHT